MDKVEVRIVAGEFRGRKLGCVVHAGLRPTPQLVREALFSILGNAVPGSLFYDVFAGSGVVGLEAVSRGAKGARLIERDAAQAAELQRTVTQWRLAARVQVLRADAYRWAERWMPGTEAVNVFFSPPFPDLAGEKAAAFAQLIHAVWGKLPPQSVCSIQVEVGFDLAVLPEATEWDARDYGRNRLLFRVKEPGATDEPPHTP